MLRHASSEEVPRRDALGRLRDTDAFNQDIGGWDMRKVVTFESMRDAARHPKASSVARRLSTPRECLDARRRREAVPRRPALGGRFSYAIAFNNGGQPLNWNTEKVVDMAYTRDAARHPQENPSRASFRHL